MKQIENNTLDLYDYANIFNIYEDDNGIQFFNLYNSLVIDGEIDKTLYTEIYLNDGDNWYALSQKYYGTHKLWWVALVINNIINPFEDLPNKKIKILNSIAVSNILGQMKSGT